MDSRGQPLSQPLKKSSRPQGTASKIVKAKAGTRVTQPSIVSSGRVTKEKKTAKQRGSATTEVLGPESDTLDLLDRSDIVSSRAAATMKPAARAYERTATRRLVAANSAATKNSGASRPSAKSIKLLSANATATSSATATSMPPSLSPSSPSKMQRGTAFPVNTRAGGWKSPAQRAKEWQIRTRLRKDSPKERKVQDEEVKSGANGQQDREQSSSLSPKHVQELSAELEDLSSQIRRRVEADMAIQNAIDVSDPEQVKARLATEISNSMFYQRESQHASGARDNDLPEVDSDGVYEDTGDHDSDLEDSATLDKPPSPSASRRPSI